MKKYLLKSLSDLEFLKLKFDFYDHITINFQKDTSLFNVVSYAIKYSFWAIKLNGKIDIKTKGHVTSSFEKNNLDFWQISSTLHYTLTNKIETLYSNPKDGDIKIKKISDPYVNNSISFGIIASGIESENNFLFNSINSIIKNKEIDKIKYEIIIFIKSINSLSNTIKNNSKIKIIFFDNDMEGSRFMIGRKKYNLYEQCKHDIVSISHARIIYPNNFIKEIIGRKFDFFTTKINTLQNNRYLDIGLIGSYNISKLNSKAVRTGYFIPNSFYRLLNKRCVYIDGGLSIYNKKVLNFNPFNKYLAWGEGEDIKVSELISVKGFLVDYYSDLVSYSQNNKTKRKNNIKTKLKNLYYNLLDL